jgi:hypothetical protein
VFLPRISSPIYVGNTFTTNSFPITAIGSTTAYTPDLSSIVDRYRVVGFGVEFTSVGRADAEAGWLTLLTSCENELLQVTGPTDVGVHKDVFPIRAGETIRWVSGANGSAAHDYIAFAETAAGTTYGNWTYLYAFAEGINSSTTIRARVVLHLECLPKENTVYSLLLEDGPHINSGGSNIVTAARNIASGFLAGASGRAEMIAMQAAKAAGTNLVDLLLSASSLSGAYRVSRTPLALT